MLLSKKNRFVKISGRFFQNLWPSYNVWTLINVTKTLKSIWLSMADQNWMICSNLYFWRYPYHNLLFLAKYQNKTKKQASKITNKLKWKKSCLIAVEFISDIAWVTNVQSKDLH